LTFDSAWKQIRNRVPEEFFSINNNLPVSTKVQYGIVTVAGLSIAYLSELNRQGVELVDVHAIKADFDAFVKEPVEMLTNSTLNLGSLVQDDRIENELKVIMEQPTFEDRLEVAADHLLTHFDVSDST
jgi:hypothetical protein